MRRALVLFALAIVACDRPKKSEPAVTRDDDDDSPAPTAQHTKCDHTVCGPSCVDLDSDPAHCGKCDKTCADGESCAGSVCAAPTDWAASAVPHRCSVGNRFGYLCPPNGTLGSVYGTGLYTDDSSICSAAVHAGKIDAVAGGAVAIEVRDAKSPFVGSTHNGVTSHDWATSGCAFVFVGNGCAPDVTACGAECVDLKSDAAHCGACEKACGADESCVDGACAKGKTVGWNDAPTTLRCPKPGEATGDHATYICPPSTLRATVWGTDVYTNDSSICTAAVHAGKIGSAGGAVVIEARPGLSSYKSSLRFGVKSTAYGPWKCSFVFK